MTEFGVASTLDVEVDDASLQAARDEVERELGDITVTPAADTTSGGGASSALPMTDGGTSIGEQLAEQTELLEDIEDHAASAEGGGGGLGGTFAKAAGTYAIASAIGTTGLAGLAGGGLQFGVQELASELSPAVDQTIGNRREMTFSPDGVGEAVAANFMRVIDPAGIGETLGRSAISSIQSFDASQFGSQIVAEVETIDASTIGENIGSNVSMALDPAGIGQTFAREARSELSSVFDPLTGGGGQGGPTDAQTIMDNNEGALMASDRGLAEAAADANRARQQRQKRSQMDVDVGPIDFDLSGLDEIDQRLDDIASRVKEQIRQEVLGS